MKPKKLNQKGFEHASSLIKEGKVDISSKWSMTADEENAILGAHQDWGAYGEMHLGIVPDSGNDTKKSFGYPFGKDGKVYRSALEAIRDRAGQQHETEIFDAAGKLIEMLDGQKQDKMRAAVTVTGPVGEKSDPQYGFKWRVQVIEYGPGKDGRINWPKEPLVAALPLFNKSRVFMLGDSQHQDPKNSPAFGKSPRDLVGWLTNPEDTGTGINADFDILTSAAKLRSDLLDAFERGNPDFLGLSVDVDALTKTVMVAGKKMKEPVKIIGVETDVVYDPTNNGRFLKLLAAASGPEDDKEDAMYQKLLAALKAQRPDLAGQIDTLITKGESVTDADISTLLAAAMPGQQALDIEKLVAAMKDDKGTEILRKMQLQACSMMLSSELKDSGLPDLSVVRMRKLFDGKVFEVADLTAAIKDEKEYVDKLTGSGIVTGSGRVTDVQGEAERLQAAFDRTFGVNVDDRFKDVPAFDGLRAAYVRITGDTNVTGVIDRQRLTAAFDSSTFSFVLGNTLYRRMVQDYKETADYGVSRLISTVRNAKDFRTLESVKIAYMSDIPDVNPEDANYVDLGSLADEEVSYSLNQKGGLITITRRMILNDDMSVVSKIIGRAPRAARRTLAKRIWNKFISNATYKGDSKAIFHTDHNNLGTAAYSIAAALAARTAIRKQTEPGSGERINLRPVTVAFPSDLFGTVTNVNNYNPTAAVIDDANPMFNFFKAEGLIEVPFMTDVTDWMMFGDPKECEIIEIAYLNGQQEPEMFIADNPAVGQVFLADKIQYKIRHEYEAEAVDFRNCYKAVVAG